MAPSTALPIWSPHQISESNGVENALRKISLGAGLDPETVTDLQHAFGVGSAIWENQYLVIEKAGAPKPTHPDGALHYVAGWLATDPYLEVLNRWGTREPFFHNLHRLAKEIRRSDSFLYCSDGPMKMVSNRLIDGGSYVKRGHLPFPELLFRTWKTGETAYLPQIALWASYLNYNAYQATHRRNVFDEPVLDLLGQIRNAIAPEKNGGTKWIPLKETLRDMPQVRTPNDVKSHLLGKAQENLGDEGWIEISRNIRKIGVLSRPLVYIGSKKTQSESKRLEIINRFKLDDEDLPNTSNTTKTNGSSKKLTKKRNPRLTSREVNQSGAPQAKQEPSSEESFLAQVSGKIGSKNLEFSQRAIYAENPFLSFKDSVDIEGFLNDLNLKEFLGDKLLHDHPNKLQADELESLAILIWSAIQVGGNLVAAASMVINYTPQKGFGLQPDLSGIWRTRAQQQKATPEVSQEMFLSPLAIEQRSFPDRLASHLKRIWTSDFCNLGDICHADNKSLREMMREIGLQLGQTKTDWTSNLLRTFIAKTRDNETGALLLQSNAETNFTSDAAYYSVIYKHPNGLQNIAGSPYFFRLEVFAKYLNNFLGQSYPKNHIDAWNLWTDKVLAVLSCTTGARPVVDLFAEVENFSEDFNFVIVDDKEVVTRDSRRIIQLPKKVATLLRQDYIQSLKDLQSTFPANHPIREGIVDLIQKKCVFWLKLDKVSRRNWTRIPFEPGHGFWLKLDKDSSANWRHQIARG